jgi:Family of unknown function (DUF6152)
MPLRKALILCLGMVVGAPISYAHHSAAAAFTTNVIDIEGYVTEFNFSNPHVNIYLNVTGDDGKTTRWMATDAAATLLRRRGWTVQTVKPGQFLRITGRESRDGSPMILVQHIAELDPADGSVVRDVRGESDYQELVGASLALELGDGRPNFTGAWTMGPPPGGRRPPGQGPGGPPRPGAGPPPGGPPGDRTPPPYNEAGTAMRAKFDPIGDPAVHCEAPGLVRQAGFTPHPVRITQETDHVIFDYEEYGGRRVIALANGNPAADGDEHTNLGRSVAHYEGDTLVIETTHLLGNYTSPLGNPLSDQATTVETYRRADDPKIGAALEMTMVITDPAYLAAPWTLRWKKYYTPGYEFIKVDCRVPYTYREPR